VRRVSGRLVTEGPLFFNWKPDPRGHHLERALAGREGAGAWASARSLDAGIESASLAAVAVSFGPGPGGARPGGAPLVVYRSPSLRAITKALNSYSNNVFHPLADRIGGAAEVERIARESVPADVQTQVLLVNGAGAGTVNRLSPRAAVEITAALARELGRHRLDLVDVLPVSGIDVGTLQHRLDGPGERGVVVGKTGTFGSVGASALAGVVSTERFGRVTFAVLNKDVAVPEARRRQDAFVRAIIAAGGAKPLDYTMPVPSPLTEVEVREAGAAARR
jgi:D-alanyl-D-alanine carboxypeptidase